MSPKPGLVVGMALVAAGAVIAFLEDSWGGAAAAAIVVVGLGLAIWSLSIRDDGCPHSHDQPRPGDRVANALIVTVSAAAGGLSAATSNDAWFAVAVFVALVIWSMRPGLMD